MRRPLLTIVAGCFAVFVTAALAYYVYGRSAYVRIAVARGTIDQQIMQEAVRILRRERDPIRFRLVLVNDAAAGAQALDTGNADFAILPTNESLPVLGKTAVIMRQNAVFLLAPAGAGIKTISDLRGKTIGLLQTESSDDGRARILDEVLARQNLSIGVVSRYKVDFRQLSAMLASKTIDAVFVDSVAGDGPAADAVNAVAAAGGGEPVFIPAGHASALAQQSLAFEQLTIAAGTFGGAATRPPQDLETVAVSVRLFASTNLRDSLVGNVTRVMFSLKPKLALTQPIALRIRAPSTSKDSSLPVHPGAAAYLDGEEESFYDRFSEVFYLGAMILSLIGSAIAAVASRLGSGGKRRYQATIDRLLEILRLARQAADMPALTLLQNEADDIFASAMSATAGGALESPKIAALEAAVDQVHQAVRDRRAQLFSERPAKTESPEPLRSRARAIRRAL